MQEHITALKDKTRAERWKSVVALEQVGKPATEYLILALKDEDKWVRYAAADALGCIGDQSCVDHLIKSLNDIDQDVRFATAEALGKIGDRKACDALNSICSNDNGYVQIAAEEALEKLKQ